jgi:hypothetical protein
MQDMTGGENMLSLIEELWLLPEPVVKHIAAVRNAKTLPALVLAGVQLGLALGAWVVQEELSVRGQAVGERPVCSVCGRPLESKGLVARRVQTLLGLMRWRRRVWRCPRRCHIGQVAPYDDELGLAPYQQTSGELQQLACEFAVFMPFRLAAYFVTRTFALVVEPKSVWNWVQQAGATASFRVEQALEALAQAEALGGDDGIASTPEESLRQLPLVLGADGVMVPFRPQTGTSKGKTVWREVKVGVLARLGQRFTRMGKPVTIVLHRHVVAVLGDIEALRNRLWLAAVYAGIHASPMVVWVSDGARGLWRIFAERFDGRALGVLDFYHAAQHVWRVAKAYFDGRTTRAKLWFQLTRHRLKTGQAAMIIAELAGLAKSTVLPASVQKTLTQVSAYLAAHQHHLAYPLYEELGLPRGSGMVESACKWLIQQRFKGVGMRWSEEGFNHLLHLRLAWVNGEFTPLFTLAHPVSESP